MKIIISLFTAIILLSAPAYGASQQEVTIKVNGLVCDFCARAIEKVFGKRDDVSSVKVDLSTKLITIVFKSLASPSDDELRTLIADSGYDVVSIQRGEER